MTPQDTLRRALLNDEFPDSEAFFNNQELAGVIPDRLQFERNAAVAAWMRGVSGREVNPSAPDWQASKDALAQGFFKLSDRNVSDEQMHSLIRSHIQTAEDAATMAAEGGLTGVPLPEIVSGLRAKRGASQLRPIFNRYEQDAIRRHTALTVKLAPYRGLVNQVAGELGQEMESTLPTTQKFQDVAEKLLQVPEEDRPLVLQAIGATGGKDAKERASYLAKLAGAMGRMTETMGASVVSATSQAGLAEAEASLIEAGQMEFAGKMETERKRQRDFDLLTQQIRSVADQEVDPIKGDGWWSQLGIDLARMVPQSAVTVANPALGMAANYAYFENTLAGEAMMRNPGMTPDQARAVAGVAAPLNAAVETVTALIPFGKFKLPFVQKWLQATATSIPTAAARAVVRTATGTAAEIGEEYLQSYIPLRAQELLKALNADMPGVDWETHMPKFSEIAAQTWGPALVYSLVGAGSVSISEVNGGRALARDTDLMVAQGLAPATAEKIAQASESNDWQQVDALFRSDFTNPQKASDTEKAEATARYLDKIKAQQSTESMNAKEAANLGVRVFRDAESWKVEMGDGSVVKVDSAESARRMRDDIRMASTEYEADTMTALVDDIINLRPQTRVEIRPEIAMATDEGIQFVDPITNKVTKINNAQSFQNLRNQAAAIDGDNRQDLAQSARLILGDNYVEFGESVARVFRSSRGQSDSVPAAITAGHEVIESSFRRGLASGLWTEQDARNAIGSLLPALESGIQRLGKKASEWEKDWLENAKKAVATGDSILIRETISEMGVRAWIGRDRDGNKTGLRPGAILRALDAAILQEQKPEKVTTYQRIRAWFKAVGAYLKGVVATAKIIRDAERNGTIEDFTAFLDKVLGLEAATREESEVTQGVKEMAFSLSPTAGIDVVSDTLESWQGVFDAAARRNPTRAMAIREKGLRDLAKLADSYTQDRWTAKGDKIRALVEKRTKKSLDDEQAMREALLEGEKIAAGMDAGQAKAEAKAEAAAWRQEADDMQAEDWSPRESLVRDMRTLNIILSAFPPEVRAKVTGGSMVKLAGLATERARYKAINTALQKAMEETEKFMRKEYTALVDDMLDVYRSRKDDSGRISGKLPSQYTELIDYAYRIREMDVESQATESDGLEKALEKSESDEETQRILTKLGIVRLFEVWDTKDSVAMGAASDWLSGIIESGKLGRKLLDEDRKAMLDEFRGIAKKNALPEGEISRVDVANEANNVRFKVFRRAWQELNGALDSALHTMAQRLELVFGENSKVADYFTTRLIQAANASTDIKREINRSYHDILSVVFNTRSRLGHARAIGAMQKVKASGIMLTEGRVVEEVKLDIETLTKLSDGTMTAEAAGLRQDQVEDALNQWAASNRKRTVTVEVVKNAGTQKERQMTELQGIQWWLWSRQDDSRKQMERDGWTEESFKQLEEFLSPEAKALGQWIASSYDQAARMIDPVYRRLFNAPLPRVKNYAPIYRVRSGDAAVMDLDASDISSGLSAGFTKSRVNTVSPLAEMDAITVMLTHWENVAHWVTHAEVVRDAKAILLDRDVQTAIKQKSGKVSADSIKARVAAIESQGTNAARELVDLSRWWRRIMQYQAFKGLAFRLSPVVKQTSALLNPLLADVPAHSYAVGLARAFTDPAAFGRDVAEMWKSDTIVRRIEGGFSAEARIAMQGEGAAGSVALAWMQRGMMPMAWTDAGWTALGAAISYDYYRRGYMAENPGTPAAMADAYATKQLEKMIAKSAQPSDIVNRSLVEASSNPFMRSLWMFASDQRKALGIEVTALKKLLSGKSKNKALDIQRILVAHFAQAAVTQLMASILASFIGDEEDKEREWSREQWALSLAIGPINGLFVFGRFIDMAGRRLLGLRVFPGGTVVERVGNDVVKGATAVDELFNPEDPEEFIDAMNKVTAGASGIMSMAIGPQAGVADVTANLLREGQKVMDAASDD